MVNFAVYNLWVCLYAVVFRVGKSGGNARHKEHMFKGTSPLAGGDTYMVLSHYISLLRAH